MADCYSEFPVNGEGRQEEQRMSRANCWAIEDYAYRSCSQPARKFGFAVSPHNHSCHSIENLASLNQVVKLWFMRPFRHVLQRAFGLAPGSDLDYAEVYYRPPLTVEDVLRTESAGVAPLGFDGVHLGITDHDEVAGSVELLRKHPANAPRNALGEERLDDLFEILRASGCLVVLNHPLVPWGKDNDPRRKIPVEELLRRYGWAIHALEYNGMRSREENDRVLELAKQVNKPVIGGGDSHLLLASSVLSVTHARSFRDFAAEVKEGRAVPLVTPAYFAPLRWKIFLRVLYFIAHYRQIGHFRGQPVRDLLADRAVLLDPIGVASRGFLSLTSACHLIR